MQLKYVASTLKPALAPAPLRGPALGLLSRNQERPHKPIR